MKWISVKDKKPKDDGLFWVCHEKFPTAYAASYSNESEIFISLADPGYILNATHYYELPLTPKQKQISEQNEKRCKEYKKMISAFESARYELTGESKGKAKKEKILAVKVKKKKDGSDELKSKWVNKKKAKAEPVMKKRKYTKRKVEQKTEVTNDPNS